MKGSHLPGTELNALQFVRLPGSNKHWQGTTWDLSLWLRHRPADAKLYRLLLTPELYWTW